ncbi:hypothetical protein [Azospirillum sp. BE72]|uniref:hypothetical protein n=1 Tax=Azospirillum sp. BE72 TaxID=2817776 RepID=UPI002858B880|nr:hypothetical protein [Azospirillum sp. BE72]MDR6773419.1 LPS O-antigen subunit length determinant protein (WzzB/FepE family) [Azospirillum sp. BE72]
MLERQQVIAKKKYRQKIKNEQNRTENHSSPKFHIYRALVVPELPEDKRLGPERHRAQPEPGTYPEPPGSLLLYRGKPQ